MGVASRFNNDALKISRARRLRRDATDVESALWHKLRNRQLGVSFRRQHPAGPYVLDFYCAGLGLAIELDGGQHAARKVSDNARTKWLNECGVKVVRFWNSDVSENLAGVLERINTEIEIRRSSSGVTPTRRWRADLPLSGGGAENARGE